MARLGTYEDMDKLIKQDWIIDEVLDYQISELEAGRVPVEIPLTEDQRKRLKEWMDSTETTVEAPDGSLIAVPGVKYSDGMILGMKITKAEEGQS